jgi:hypothetical protein
VRASPARRSAIFFRVADRQRLANPEKVPPLHHRATPLFLRLRLLCVERAAIALQYIGDVLGNLVAGAVAADDDVAHGGLAGKVMLPWRA